jgi:hypothetical protein
MMMRQENSPRKRRDFPVSKIHQALAKTRIRFSCCPQKTKAGSRGKPPFYP